MILTIDNRRLRELIPGVIHEVDDEASLYDKMLPWLNSANAWLEDNFIGSGIELPQGFNELVEKIIVNKAFAEAIPSLDVVLSPAGFAVISTDGRAPASKERIERLVSSLNSYVDANTSLLISKLHLVPQWNDSEIGNWWCATFIPDLSDAYRFRGQNSLLDTYRSIRSHALRFEQEVAESYLGNSTLDTIRKEQFSSDPNMSSLIRMIREAELRYISFHVRDQSSTQSLGFAKNTKCPDDHEVWHLVRPIIARLAYYPEIHRLWQSEMGHRFKVEPFKNDIRGGFYF